MRGTNHDPFKSYVREAAGIFESIGKLESAASCYCDLGEYERAGKIYLSKCGKIDAAAECFTLSGCYNDAAEAYAKGDMFSNCLSVCIKGKLFDKGMQYIEYWKEHVNVRSKEIRKMEQEFLENGALDYHQHKDPKSMMKFVRAFCSMKFKRVFLRSLGRLDDLLSLEEESGHFVEAAELARSLGDVLKEADLLEKAGQFRKAALLVLWYVLLNLLWGNGNKGWPLKQFPQKEELCNKVKWLAKQDSYTFYDLVCNELNVLSDQRSSLTELKKDLDASRKYKSLRGEILSTRKILDAHFRLSSSKYEWEDKLPIDINKHCEEMIFQNRVSVRTLVYYWNLWKENACGIFHDKDLSKQDVYIDFILYFGARRHHVDGLVYQLVFKDAHWIRNTSRKGLCRDREFLTMDVADLVPAMRSYWESELLSVGIKVVETLESLYQSKSNGSAFHQGISLLHIYNVSSFLLCCNEDYFELMFPLDWRKSMSEDLISLRKTDLSINLLDETVLENVAKGDLDYWTIRRVMTTYLGFLTSVAVYEILIKKLESKPMWKLFIEKLRDVGFKEDLVLLEFMLALNDAFRADLLVMGYIQPDSPRILYERYKTSLWCSLSSEDRSFYHKLLALKLVMMLALVLLEESNYSQVLLNLLMGSSNITDLLPQKFVSSLLRRRDDLSPKIHAPCAIFVDLNKSKEEIMRVLFPRKNTHSINSSSHNVDVGTILEPPSRVNANLDVTCDDAALLEVALESQSGDGSTLDAKNKIAKGNKKGKKGKHIKGSMLNEATNKGKNTIDEDANTIKKALDKCKNSETNRAQGINYNLYSDSESGYSNKPDDYLSVGEDELIELRKQRSTYQVGDSETVIEHEEFMDDLIRKYEEGLPASQFDVRRSSQFDVRGYSHINNGGSSHSCLGQGRKVKTNVRRGGPRYKRRRVPTVRFSKLY
ncbi:UvrD-like helicase, ATP-binding domain, P-loop containing nucleoside triphosphate hydrolase [Tanacetum coccineum]